MTMMMMTTMMMTIMMTTMNDVAEDDDADTSWLIKHCENIWKIKRPGSGILFTDATSLAVEVFTH